MGISVRTRLSSVVGISIVLAACGGGDGSGTASTNAPGQAPGIAQPPQSGNETPPTAPDGSAKNSPPAIAGAPAPAVVYDTPYVFEPEAHDPDGDILHFSVANLPHWASFQPTTGRLEGTPGQADVGTYGDIVINVTDGAADAELGAFAITVAAVAGGSVELSWVPPTENTDGTPLTDLAGYKIYWGTEPGDYSNSVTLDNPGLATYVLENLVPNTYYFIATAVNLEGVESAPSAEASGTIS